LALFEIEDTIDTGMYRGHAYGIMGINVHVRIMACEYDRSPLVPKEKRVVPNVPLSDRFRNLFAKRKEPKPVEHLQPMNIHYII